MGEKKMKKFISIILLITLISGILISCGDKNTPEKPDTPVDNNTPTAGDNKSGGEDTAKARIEPDLPEKNFEGYTFTFLVHPDWLCGRLDIRRSDRTCIRRRKQRAHPRRGLQKKFENKRKI
jgi:hypothetical protein